MLWQLLRFMKLGVFAQGPILIERENLFLLILKEEYLIFNPDLEEKMSSELRLKDIGEF